MIKYFLIFFLFIVFIMKTYDKQSQIIETIIIGIPVSCLDYNEDGRYDRFDGNYYGAINLYISEKRGFELMDGKGSIISKITECNYTPNNIDKIYLEDVNCTGYCRLYGWIVYNLKNN